MLLFGQRETWHRAGVEAVKFAELGALMTRYGRMLTQRGDPYDFQTYACRPIRGSSTGYSLHSWPRATDIRPAANPLRDDGVLITDFDRFGFEDGMGFLGSFLAAGFRWGATWSADPRVAAQALRHNGQKIRDGRVDAMHLELAGEPVTTGWADRLKAFRDRNPRYFAGVMARAGATTIPDLIRRWKAGTA